MTHSGTTSELRLRAEIAELAAHAESLEDYRRRLFALLRPRLGFDHATMQSTSGHGPASVATLSWNADELRPRLPEYIAQLTDEELRAPILRVVRCEDVFSRSRADQIAIPRDFLRGHGIGSTLWRIWTSPAGLSSIVLGRSGGRAFRGPEAALLEQLLPVIRVGDAFWMMAERCPGAEGVRGARFGLTRKEEELAAQAVRGLTARELAHLRGTSVHTVRNQLASLYFKTGVSTRAELVYVLSAKDERSPVTWSLREMRVAMEDRR